MAHFAPVPIAPVKVAIVYAKCTMILQPAKRTKSHLDAGVISP
jgi:hypothetical protein